MLHLVTFTALSEFPDRLAAHFHALPADARHWTPPSWDGCPGDRLTAIERLCHCREIETEGYQARLNRAVKEDNPRLESLDTYALRDQGDYAGADPEEVIAAFKTARKRTLSILEGLTEDQWQRPAVFEGYGPTTIIGLIHFLSGHDYQHLAGLQWLMGRLSAE